MIYHIWLQSTFPFGTKLIKDILEAFGSPKGVYEAHLNDLKLSGLFSQRQLNCLTSKDLTDARKVLNDCKKNKISVIPYCSEYYPQLLREIPNPPLALYAKGNVSLLNSEPLICVIGTRVATQYGKKSAFSLSARLAAGGITVVSGGAMGIDSAAHKGALAAGGNTVCVYPSGLCTSYLSANKALREEIARRGLIISELPPYRELRKGGVPLRNRIMAGISLGVAVVEAPIKSGAIITADFAAEHGRDVFAVPGGLDNPNYSGCNRLLADGAKLLIDARTVFSEYEAMYPHKINVEAAYSKNVKMPASEGGAAEKLPKEQKNQDIKTHSQNCENFVKKNINSVLPKTAKIVYNNLDKQIFSADELRNGQLSDTELLTALTQLEIFGYIKALPGGRYEVI